MPFPRTVCEFAGCHLRKAAAWGALLLVWICLATICLATTALATWQDDIGFTQLQVSLGGQLPIGAGVAVAMAEASSDGNFFPDTTYSEFIAVDDPLGNPVNWTNGSTGPGIPAGSSNHATNSVGRYFFGNTLSVAPGANDVTVYEATDYLNIVLGYQDEDPPVVPTYVVHNHSYIGSPDDDVIDLSLLRRLDYVIDTYDVTMSVGLNNNNNSTLLPDPTKPHPNVFSYSYNAISVGNTDATHSRGATDLLYGPGRLRPDIVVPRTSTSSATAIVSSVATLLHGELAGTLGAKSEAIRAMLLAGATKEEFATFVEPTTGVANPWERVATQPLDDIFGAGELNVFNSYLMTQTGDPVLKGRYAGSTTIPPTVGSHGWDYQASITPGTDVLYDFIVPTGSTAPELSIVLAWNVAVVDTQPGPTFLPEEQELANLDLQLVDSVGATVDESISKAVGPENTDGYPLEHIYLTDLAPGTYTLKVSAETARDYGLAWRMSTLFDTPTADFDGNGLVDGADFVAWQRGFGTLVEATLGMGDADGDGDVDADDLAIFSAAAGPAAAALPRFSVAVPEPTSALLASMGLVSFFLMRRSRFRSRENG